jgi:hypothetical protein
MLQLDPDVKSIVPPRAKARPSPKDWEENGLMTLAEAVAVFFPNGPFTVRKLRTAIDNGELAYTTVSGNLFTSPKAIAGLQKLTVKTPRRAPPQPPPEDHGLPGAVMAKIDAKRNRRSRSKLRGHHDRPQ